MFMSLLFHRIEESSPSELMALSEEVFHKCIRSIKDRSIPARSLSSLCLSKRGRPGRAISLTFDDGWESDYRIAFPLLLDNGMKATFFVTTGWIDKKNHLKKSWIREMSEQGMEIGSHGTSHRYLTKLPLEEVHEELYSSKRELEDILGREISSVSIPGGEHNSEVINIARKAGYKLIATSRPGRNQANSALISRISINKRMTPTRLEKVVAPCPFYLGQLHFSYYVRTFLKKTMGVENYRRLRNRLLNA